MFISKIIWLFAALISALTLIFVLTGIKSHENSDSAQKSEPVWKYHYRLFNQATDSPVFMNVIVPTDLKGKASVSDFVVTDKHGFIQITKPKYILAQTVPVKNLSSNIPGATSLVKAASPNVLLSPNPNLTVKNPVSWSLDSEKVEKNKTLILTADFYSPQTVSALAIIAAGENQQNISGLTLARFNTKVPANSDKAWEDFARFETLNNGFTDFAPTTTQKLRLTLNLTGPIDFKSLAFFNPKSVPDTLSFVAEPGMNYWLRWNYENLIPVLTPMAFEAADQAITSELFSGLGERENIPASLDDEDQDGYPNKFDNCPTVANVNQMNSDDTAPGDSCTDWSWWEIYRSELTWSLLSLSLILWLLGWYYNRNQNRLMTNIDLLD